MSSDIINRIQTTLSDRRNDRAIEFDGQWTTWGEVSDYGDAIVALLESSGCPRHGRVGVIIRNRVAHASAVIGLLAHRRSLSFLYPFLPPAVMAAEIAALGAAAVIADEADWPHLRDAVASAGAVGIMLRAVDALPMLVPGLETPRGAALEMRPETDGAVEVLSSGTTGTPKRIAMPLRILERAAQSAPGMESDLAPDVMINIWPLGGVGGMCLLSASAANATPMALIERFSVAELVSALERHRPKMLGMSPTALSMVMDADVPVDALSSVEIISGGSAHLDPDLQDRFEQKYGMPILWAMGATEFCGTIIRWTPAMRAQVGTSKRGSVGLPMPGVELRIADPDTGDLLPHNSEGLLEVLCTAVRPDWVRTTDLAVIDEDGYVFHRGRHDGAIVRGGFKILPEKLIEVLRSHPSVADASVIGLPDARLGAVPAAAVELIASAPRVDTSALLDHIRQCLPPTYVPTRLRIVDALPRTPSLKISLMDVRTLFDTPDT